jgi:catechol 2,3-dioxygenase-like lactoylglutathione lyase family enzyme
MALHGFTHLALRVQRLRDAEAFYRELFALEVAFRETETPEGWLTLRASTDWDDVEDAGIDLGLVMLYRDGLRLALEVGDEVADAGRLSHVGVFVDQDEFKRIRAAAEGLGCEIFGDDQRALIIDDPFGVRWELNSFPYEDPSSLSTGARAGRWLDLDQRR